jgi:hypothetical protein
MSPAFRSRAAASIRVQQGAARRPQRPGHHHRLDAKGVLSDAEAREQNVGGEVLAEVF